MDVDQACKTAEKFQALYYDSMDKGRHMISTFYLEEASLVWNGNVVRGRDAIRRFYENLPTSKTTLSSIDAQPILASRLLNTTTILVHTGGTIRFQDEKHEFTQSFVLTIDGVTWKCLTDTFRFIE